MNEDLVTGSNPLFVIIGAVSEKEFAERAALLIQIYGAEKYFDAFFDHLGALIFTLLSGIGGDELLEAVGL